MKNFIKSILFFGLLFFIFDKLFLLFIAISPGKEIDKRLELILNGKMNKEIVVLGSSRGARNIIASELEKETHYSAYNLSYPGSDIEFHEFIVRTLVKFNKPPKLLVLSIDYPMAFLPDSILNFRLDRLYPLIIYKHINDELVARDKKNKVMSYLFALHRMNKSNFDIRQKKFSSLDTIFQDGSMPISFQKIGENWDKTSVIQNYATSKELKIKRDSLKKIIVLCQQNKIKLVLVLPPLFDSMNEKFKESVIQLAGDKIAFFEYDHQNQIYKDKNYFYDRTHLNNKGAIIFTGELANYLKTIKF